MAGVQEDGRTRKVREQSGNSHVLGAVRVLYWGKAWLNPTRRIRLPRTRLLLYTFAHYFIHIAHLTPCCISHLFSLSRAVIAIAFYLRHPFHNHGNTLGFLRKLLALSGLGRLMSPVSTYWQIGHFSVSGATL
jgi:hypothetical protein